MVEQCYTKIGDNEFGGAADANNTFKDKSCNVETKLIDNDNKQNIWIIPKNVPKKKIKPILSTLDILISCLVVTPGTVGCWRGVWNLMDMYMHLFPPWESYLIGAAAHMVLAMSQEILHHVFIVKKKKYGVVFSFIFIKLYTEIFTIITNLNWRGGWILYDYYMGLELVDGTVKGGNIFAVIILTVVSSICLMWLKCLRNIIAPPVAIGLDLKDEIFLFPTRFKTKDILV